MAEIRALIVDDEPLARRGIRQLLEAYADVAVVGECRDGREAVRAMAKLAPDLVFLDIQMPGLDGLGVVRLYGAERMPLTVFVTAFDAFAVKAFEAQALDYLVKPLAEPRFRATMARVHERLRQRDAMAMARRLSALLEGRAASPAATTSDRGPTGAIQRLVARTASGDRLIDVGEVLWIEANDDGARLHVDGAAYPVRESLSALESELDPVRFVRVHRNAIVRLSAVRELRSEPARRDGAVVLVDGAVLPVSRRRMAAVRSVLRSAGAIR